MTTQPSEDKNVMTEMVRWSLAARALLRRVEWAGGNSQTRRCPICGGRETAAKMDPAGHQPGCELKRLVGHG